MVELLMQQVEAVYHVVGVLPYWGSWELVDFEHVELLTSHL